SLHLVRSSMHLGADVGASPLFATLFGSPAFFPDSRGFWVVPPEVPQSLYDNPQDINRYTGGVTLNHRPASWFSHQLVVGVDYTSEDSRALERFAPSELAPFVAALGGATAPAGRISQVLRNSTVFTGDYAGRFTFDLSPAMTSVSSFGGQFVRKDLKQSTLGGTIFPAPGVETVSATAIKTDPTQSVLVNTTLGVYGQQQFGWRDRLFLTGAVRVDNNSAFGEDFDLVVYPKVSAAWVASDEQFWRIGAINTLKLRAAYGQSGQQPDAFAALRTLSPAARGNGVSGVTPESYGNAELKPERGTELELGFEAALFGRLALDFTYFTKRTKDAILERETAPSGGFPGDQFINVGEISNRGIELQATLQALTGEGLAWEISGNIATNKDRIEDLGDLPFIGIGAAQRHTEGHPISGFWSRRIASADRDPETHEISNTLCDGSPNAEPLPCDQAPAVYLGTPTPSLTAAIASTVTIARRLTLYGLIDMKSGHKLYNINEWGRCGAVVPVCEAVYRPEKYTTEYLAAISPAGFTASVADPYIQDASFARLREVSATYRIPEQWLGRIGLSSASLTIAGRNLATWTDYDGIDPEVTTPGNVGADQGLTPPLTQFIATLNFSF
ncbi:MAG: TonB-dependent receptor domain-containing protein, partial [Longimicrobiales bacterium]